MSENYLQELFYEEKKKYCPAATNSKLMVCGKPCEGYVFCPEHMLLIRMGFYPRPCNICGIRVVGCIYCLPCMLKERLLTNTFV